MRHVLKRVGLEAFQIGSLISVKLSGQSRQLEPNRAMIVVIMFLLSRVTDGKTVMVSSRTLFAPTKSHGSEERSYILSSWLICGNDQKLLLYTRYKTCSDSMVQTRLMLAAKVMWYTCRLL